MWLELWENKRKPFLGGFFIVFAFSQSFLSFTSNSPFSLELKGAHSRYRKLRNYIWPQVTEETTKFICKWHAVSCRKCGNVHWELWPGQGSWLGDWRHGCEVQFAVYTGLVVRSSTALSLRLFCPNEAPRFNSEMESCPLPLDWKNEWDRGQTE